MSQLNDLQALFNRDLERLKHEVESYEQEELLWIKKGQINNSSGNLALHICGNLRHFIGAVLLKTTYVRDRDFEFSGKVSKSDLVTSIGETLQVVDKFFESADNKQLADKYPVEVFGYPMTVFSFLVHLQGHLNYHLGQINYHRRLIKTI